MATRGVMILRRQGNEKAIYIRWDAYPSGAGGEILDLIQTADLHALYTNMHAIEEAGTSSESRIAVPGEPDMFSYKACKQAAAGQGDIWISKETVKEMRDSLFTEYAYVLDLDRKQLEFYVGFQKQPQAENPYGTTPRKARLGDFYYPCRLTSIFSFDHIRKCGSVQIVRTMEEDGEAEDPKIRFYGDQNPLEEKPFPDDLPEQLSCIREDVKQLAGRLDQICDRLREIRLSSDQVQSSAETVPDLP